MTFGYKTSVRPQHERRDYIASQVAAASTGRKHISHDVHEGTATELPLIRLLLNMPLYRMANGRTQTQQLAFIAEKGHAPTYFQNGEENETAQQVQHEILRQISAEGPDSIAQIADELLRSKQTDPLLITPSGVVVNGNRRLSAMRELYTTRPADVPSFASVECAVLPPLSAEQVDDLEIRLQMLPETKLPYGWINEGLKIEKQIARGREEEEVARVMRKKPADIRKALQALKYAKIYLQDWKKKPEDYRLVEAGEQFFNDLVTRLRGKSGDMLEANMRVAWILFDNRGDLGSRIYDFNKVIGEKAGEVLRNLIDRVDIEAPPDGVDEGADPKATAEDDVPVDFGDDTEAAGSPFGALIKVLDDDTRREEIAGELRAVCQTIIDATRTAKQGSSALGAVRDAHTRLTEVDLTRADPKTYEGIDRQLAEIIVKATDLKAKLQDYRTDGAGEAA